MKKPIGPNDLRKLIEGFVAEYPEQAGVPGIWRKPLLATAEADERFHVLPDIAAANHLLPADLLPSARAVVVFFIPFAKELAVENHRGEFPCRNWGIAYGATNALIGSVCKEIQHHLESQGFRAMLTPATHNFDEDELVSRWSHKHLGHISGLGRFGVNAQFITPSGCAGRLGSLVTDADLGNSPLVEEKELCLHKAGHRCLVCVRRCPVGAVTESGIDRRRCWERLNSNLAETEALAGLGERTWVCGKCQVLVPCSLKAPLGKSRRKKRVCD